MIGSWNQIRLSDLFDIKSSKRVHKADWKSEGVPFYRAREVVKLSQDGYVDNDLFISEELYEKFIQDKGKPSAGDIIISAVGTLGQCYLVQDDDKFYFKDASVLWFEKISDVDSRYIEYAFKSDLIKKQVHHKSMGATVGTLTISRAKKIVIPVPPLPEQKQIVSILDKAFTAIDQAKANIEKNILNAEELFQSKLNEVFSQKGDGWEEKKLGNLSRVKSGGTPLRSKNEFWDGGDIPWYSSGELNKLYTVDPKRHITNMGLENSNAKLFPKGSLLIGMYDTAALKMSIIDRDATFNQAIAGVEYKSDLNLEFVKYAIESIKPRLLKMRRGVRQKNLSLTKIQEIEISIPRLKVQNSVVSILKTINDKLEQLRSKYQQERASLDELKLSILHRAFSGELTSSTEIIEQAESAL